jgi:hypothetical protein
MIVTLIEPAIPENWASFYEWLKLYGYYVVEDSYIFRAKKLITSFDPVEDEDSGEIEETLFRIKEADIWLWKCDSATGEYRGNTTFN